LRLLNINIDNFNKEITISKKSDKTILTIENDDKEYDITEFADKSLDELRIDYLTKKGLMPNETDSFTVGDKKIYHSKKFILDSSGRTGVLLFVLQSKGKCHKVRLAYTSQSQGIWRLLPNVLMGQYNKTESGEDAISFGLEVQQNLSAIENPANDVVDPDIISVTTNILSPLNINVHNSINGTQNDVLTKNMNYCRKMDYEYFYKLDLNNISKEDSDSFILVLNKIREYVKKENIDPIEKKNFYRFYQKIKIAI
jgi:hypothetical protein